MAGRSLRIGELAAQVSLRPAASRYYEQIGLIPPPERIGAPARLPAVNCPLIALIRMAQPAGLPLADIRALFAGATPGTAATRRWRALAERKLPEIDATIQQLRLLRDVVADCLECGCMNFTLRSRVTACSCVSGEPDRRSTSRWSDCRSTWAYI